VPVTVPDTSQVTAEDIRLWRLAPRLRDAEHWGQGSAEAHRMATAHPLEGEEMPKVSKATASSHQPIPGVQDAYSHEIDGWTISMETQGSGVFRLCQFCRGCVRLSAVGRL
jgi:hypothetical protein